MKKIALAVVLLILMIIMAVAANASECKAVKDCLHKDTWRIMFCSEQKIKKALFRITDANGNVIFSRKVKVRKGVNTPGFYYHNLQPGIYTVNIHDVFTTVLTK